MVGSEREQTGATANCHEPSPSIPVVAVVLAGGTGTRLYPASRSDRPKQFLPLLGESSLLERTVSRARTVADEVVVLTRDAYADGVRERVSGVEVLVEPAGRDTGPALLYATHWIDQKYDDCVVVALPSDHLVGEGFAAAIRRGVAVADATDRLVTFGVEPTRPETGYGYIEAVEGADTAGEASEPEWHPVGSFHEKPDADTAESYVDAGHYWNAGLFAWSPERFLAAADAPPLAPLLDALRSDDDATVRAAFESIDPVSVDHAVFETADDVAVVPVSFPWDDIGSWDALERVADAGDANGDAVDDVGSGMKDAGSATADDANNVAADDANNVVTDDANTVTTDDADNVATDGVTLRTLDAADNVVAADDAHVSLIGVSDLAVVTWDDRVLVVPTERAQDVKELVQALEERGEF